MLTLNDSIKYLKGVGEKRADYFKKLDIFTPLDLLYHFPRDYTDYSSPVKIADAASDEYSVIKGTLVQKMREANIRRGLTIIKQYSATAKRILPLSFITTAMPLRL